jgi:6-phosphogluconolactonase
MAYGDRYPGQNGERFMADLRIYSDLQAMAQAAGEYLAAAAQASVESGDLFSLMLAGGSTPRALHARLSQEPLRAAIDWGRTHVFWGDERCVPPGHPDSNYRMARETLLENVPLSQGNIHRMPAELGREQAAAQYQDEMRAFFVADRPVFDLILLGMGGDGHTVSLFPGSPWLGELSRLVAPVEHSGPPAPEVDRVTVTPPLINAARRVVFFVSGERKAQALAHVLRGPRDPEQHPAQVVRPDNGELVWFIDRAAASEL